MNKFKPKYTCIECKKTIWNFDLITKKFRCKFCNTLNEKELHGIIGAELSMSGKLYVIEFPEFKEKSMYPTWEDLMNELNELEKGEI